LPYALANIHFFAAGRVSNAGLVIFAAVAEPAIDTIAPTAAWAHAEDLRRLLHVSAAARLAAPAEIPDNAAPTTHPLPPAQQKPYATIAAIPATVEIVPA
jgi:hypothetical protein